MDRQSDVLAVALQPLQAQGLRLSAAVVDVCDRSSVHQALKAHARVDVMVGAALVDRERSGRAQSIDASLLRAAIAMQAGRMIWARDEGREVVRDLRPGKLAGIHPTREGWLYLQAQSPKFWTALYELTGLDELAADPRYQTMTQRKAHEDELVRKLQTALLQRSALEWEALFGDQVPCAAVRTVEDLFDNPQILSQSMRVRHEHPTLGAYDALVGPVRIDSGFPASPERRAPGKGEHADELLREWGLSEDEIGRLHAAGAVHRAN